MYIYMILILLCLGGNSPQFLLIAQGDRSVTSETGLAPFSRAPLELQSSIPKTIWTFWDGCIPHIILSFISNWCITNPGYKINIITLENYRSYIDIEDLESLRVTGMAQRVSDIARLNVIAKHGGFWVDSSVLFTRNLDWIIDIQKDKKVEFVGYYIKADTTLPSSPIIENWFFAAVPGSEFVSDWHKEYMRLPRQFQHAEDYIQDLVDSGVDLQLLGDPDYLTQHAALQKVLQKGGKQYRYFVMDCYLGPYYYLVHWDWESKLAVKALASNTSLHSPIIKLRGWDRSQIDMRSRAIGKKLLKSKNLKDTKSKGIYFLQSLFSRKVTAQEFFPVFGVDISVLKEQLCQVSLNDDTCTVIVWNHMPAL
ncbi:hypothetical protein CEUSTIGMA_g9622.t1 [Chlamydomonas eustigma]|uniref:Alpha 1,4-glycosyltransferase domain-containing protein n=1 Tax=Chlamydomonas eustigma TaxID=1157962 RepID=A0A250XGI8_9CHLO|nr:hypothetical protein CEUSTIGMA_g9622.t1 [Chlamydomonas eustigma]|eukprot:GAX82194.1 hypothetical protein CEUSTIGMA_g9622.t1 [Chlamydomonas eustigma]